MIPWRLEVFDTLGSTSDFCIERAKSGEREGLAVLARQQTAGRGSRGRQWQAPVGNLNLSVLLKPFRPVDELGFFPLLAGIAVADTVSAFLPETVSPMLKWPNDVLLNDAKLAGVLVDATPRREFLDWLVIGIGINLSHAPILPDRRTTDLHSHGGEAAPEEAADILLKFLDFWLERLHSGPADILDSWLERGHRVGTELTVMAGGENVTGQFAGLSYRGELLLNVENRIERFSTGEIFLGSRG